MFKRRWSNGFAILLRGHVAHPSCEPQGERLGASRLSHPGGMLCAMTLVVALQS